MNQYNQHRTFSVSSRIVAFVLLLLVPCLLLVGFEISLRALNIGLNPKPFLTHPGDPRYWADNPDDFQKKYYAKTRPVGLSEFPNLFLRKKPAGLIRGIVIGESTAQGTPYRRNHAFPKMTEAIINNTSGAGTLEILNIAGSALSSFYVRDIVRWLPEYQPDFVVIYAGHNEYYGTLSVASGTPAWVQRLRARIKDYRLAQIIMSLAQAEHPPHPTLMAGRFDNTHFPRSQARDIAVANVFVDNIKHAVNALHARGIRVYLFRPTSNAQHFPPFRGHHEDAVIKMLAAQGIALPDDLPDDLPDALVQHMHEAFPDSAHLCWLWGNRTTHNSNTNLSCGIDEDNVPFRARQALLQALDHYAESQNENPLFRYVNVTGELLDHAALTDRKIFIDQLHFSVSGNIVVSNALARSIAADYFPIKKNAVFTAHWEPEHIKALVRMTPFDELYAVLHTQRALSHPPYNQMLIPFMLKPEEHLSREGQQFLNDPEIQSLILDLSGRHQIISRLSQILLEKNMLYRLEQQLLSEIWNNPAQAYWYERLGTLYAGFDKTRHKGLYYWGEAHRLAFDKKDMALRIKHAYESSAITLSWNAVTSYITIEHNPGAHAPMSHQ